MRAVKTALLENDQLVTSQVQRIIDENPSESEREATELLDVIRDEFGKIMGEFRRESSLGYR